VAGDIYRSLTGISLPEDHAFLEGWGHLVGYDAGYYGYLYAKVFATCIFEERFSGKVLDPTVGKEFRDTVLSPGDTRDFMDSIVRFVGKMPDPNTYIQKLLAEYRE
jgi:Zn-dependent oligopeptidase